MVYYLSWIVSVGCGRFKIVLHSVSGEAQTTMNCGFLISKSPPDVPTGTSKVVPGMEGGAPGSLRTLLAGKPQKMTSRELHV